MKPYQVVGEPYKLVQVPGAGRHTWEYTVSLIRGGRVVSEWDSYSETYNGTGHLTYQRCVSAIAEIRRDVEKGEIKKWF